MKHGEPQSRLPSGGDGRDEMNLADFPISALQRQQPFDEHGRKLDRLVFESSRYDPTSKQRVNQRVTLTSSAEDGLPTPADEHVVLALLYVAKHGSNFTDPTVKFAPSQLFDIMGWAANGRSYTRLRGVLRRLKSLTIRYENAWWDAAGRGYEEEVATGIIAGYRIARQVSGPRTADTKLQSWVTWTPQFFDSLQKGNIKRLDLDVFFKLRTPTAQRMYRFLDKRFYNNPSLSLDLIEFACGHVGLTESPNVAVLKRRLAPGLKELEEIHFIVPMTEEERYQKIKPGVWRIHFRAGELLRGPHREPTLPSPSSDVPLSAEELARAFYRLWDGGATAPGPRDLEQAQAWLREQGVIAAELVPLLVQVVRKEWPECRSLSGALQKYGAEAVQLWQRHKQREEDQRQSQAERQQQQEAEQRRLEEERRRREAWERLSEEEKQRLRQRVREKIGGSHAPEAFIHRFCLEEL
jgi:Replication initiator protein A